MDFNLFKDTFNDHKMNCKDNKNFKQIITPILNNYPNACIKNPELCNDLKTIVYCIRKNKDINNRSDYKLIKLCNGVVDEGDLYNYPHSHPSIKYKNNYNKITGRLTNFNSSIKGEVHNKMRKIIID